MTEIFFSSLVYKQRPIKNILQPNVESSAIGWKMLI